MEELRGGAVLLCSTITVTIPYHRAISVSWSERERGGKRTDVCSLKSRVVGAPFGFSVGRYLFYTLTIGAVAHI